MNKDIIIGILVTYVSLDILMGIIVYQKNPGVLDGIQESVTSGGKGYLAVLMALALGCLVSNCFGQKNLKLF